MPVRTVLSIEKDGCQCVEYCRLSILYRARPEFEDVRTFREFKPIVQVATSGIA